MIITIFLDALTSLLQGLLSLMPAIEIPAPSLQAITTAINLMTNFVSPSVLTAAFAAIVFWVGFYVFYTPISWIITKIPTISD